jgi:hypothetical protein
VLDNMDDTIPGTRITMPSGYDLCQHFLQKVLAKCPVTLRVTIQAVQQSQMEAAETAGFFVNNQAFPANVDQWYGQRTRTMLLQGIEMAKQLAPSETANGNRNHDDSRPGPSNRGAVDRKDDRKDKRKANRSPDRPTKKDFEAKTFPGFMARLKAHKGIQMEHLHQDKGQCLFCGHPGHQAATCTVDLARKFASEPAKVASLMKAKAESKAYFGNE